MVTIYPNDPSKIFTNNATYKLLEDFNFTYKRGVSASVEKDYLFLHNIYQHIIPKTSTVEYKNFQIRIFPNFLKDLPNKFNVLSKFRNYPLNASYLGVIYTTYQMNRSKVYLYSHDNFFDKNGLQIEITKQGYTIKNTSKTIIDANKYDFIIFDVIVSSYITKYLHANTIIYNCKNGILEWYEPNYDSKAHVKTIITSESMKYNIVKMLEQIIKNNKLQTSKVYLPDKTSNLTEGGFQELARKTVKIGSQCMFWTWIITDMRILNPNKSLADITLILEKYFKHNDINTYYCKSLLYWYNLVYKVLYVARNYVKNPYIASKDFLNMNNFVSCILKHNTCSDFIEMLYNPYNYLRENYKGVSLNVYFNLNKNPKYIIVLDTTHETYIEDTSNRENICKLITIEAIQILANFKKLNFIKMTIIPEGYKN
jgi:hypothetical protein